MNKILEEYIKWKENHDDDYIVDEIFDFLHDFDRGEIVGLLDWIEFTYKQQFNSEKWK